METLQRLIKMGGRASLSQLMEMFGNISEGTVLNRMRELRHLGILSKDRDVFVIRPNMQKLDDCVAYVRDRLDKHVVVSALRGLKEDSITHRLVKDKLKENYPTYGFSSNTWRIYANYMISWMRYSNISLGGRLIDQSTRVQTPESFTPQLQAEKTIDAFMRLDFKDGATTRDATMDKLIYDLKGLGLVNCTSDTIHLTPKGRRCRELDTPSALSLLAEYACQMVKIRRAAEILKTNPSISKQQFRILIAPLLSDISSRIYKNKTITVLKSWGDFVICHAPNAVNNMKT